MEKHGIVIKGWTYPLFISPSDFKRVADVKRLFDAVCSGACTAEKLDDQVWHARIASNQARLAAGENVYKLQEYREQPLGNDNTVSNANPTSVDSLTLPRGQYNPTPSSSDGCTTRGPTDTTDDGDIGFSSSNNLPNNPRHFLDEGGAPFTDTTVQPRHPTVSESGSGQDSTHSVHFGRSETVMAGSEMGMAGSGGGYSLRTGPLTAEEEGFLAMFSNNT